MRKNFRLRTDKPPLCELEHVHKTHIYNNQQQQQQHNNLIENCMFLWKSSIN